MSDNPNQILAEELLREAKRSRRQHNLRSGGFFLFICGLILYNFLNHKQDAEIPENAPYISIVRVDGVIDATGNASPRFLEPILTKAFLDNASRGVVLLINSPGGTPVQSHILHKLVQHLKDETGKKVVAIGEDMLTSGAYLLATAADQIYVNESTMIGSIGVVQQSYGYADLLDKVGIEARVIQAGENKVRLNPLQPVDKKDLQKVQGVLNEVHKNFINIVMSNRKDRLQKNSPELFSGDYWTGNKAVEYGLADKLGTATEAMKAEFRVKYAKDYSQRRGIMSGLSDMMVSIISRSLVKAGSIIEVNQRIPQPVLQ